MYSSGPGIYLRLVHECLLGLRRDALGARRRSGAAARARRAARSARGRGEPARGGVPGRRARPRPDRAPVRRPSGRFLTESNPYRPGGAEVPIAALGSKAGSGERHAFRGDRLGGRGHPAPRRLQGHLGLERGDVRARAARALAGRLLRTASRCGSTSTSAAAAASSSRASSSRARCRPATRSISTCAGRRPRTASSGSSSTRPATTSGGRGARDFEPPAAWSSLWIREPRDRVRVGARGRRRRDPARRARAGDRRRARAAAAALWIDDLRFEDLTYRATPIVRSSSAEPGFAEPRALDGSMSSGWRSAPGEPQWLTIDFQEEREVGGLVVHWEPGAGARAFGVETLRGRPAVDRAAFAARGRGRAQPSLHAGDDGAASALRRSASGATGDRFGIPRDRGAAASTLALA